MNKKIIISALLIAATSFCKAQQQEGMVVYERTVKLNFSFSDMASGMEQQMPTSRTDKYELLFANNKTLWKQAERDNTDDDLSSFSNNGMQIRMVSAGSDNVLFTDLSTGKSVEKRELFDKLFIIDDTLNKLKWKMTGETKMISGHNTMKATTTRTSKRMEVNMDNGKMDRKEVEDTSEVVAWFATDIPVSAGPSVYQGQLPGLILELDIKNGNQVYKAISITEKAELASIKEPAGKKRYTQEEFNKERDKMMEEMNRNNQGGNRVIRMN